jgi:peptidoglycan/xylan/chitin deacetylase (PgdA/CDA1 family)
MSGFACLTYHGIGDETDQYTVGLDQLCSHLGFLRGEGYVVEGFEQLEARIRGRIGIPLNYAVFTMDDGLECTMAAADLLARYAFRATFFITQERCVRKPGYIRLPQIRELRRAGFSLGTHGATHRILTHLAPGACADELRESKSWLEDVLGEPVRYMSAPGGYVSRRVLSQAYAHGYSLVGTCREQLNSNRMPLPGTVSRVNVRRHFSAAAFRHILQGNAAFYALRQIRSLALWVPKELFAWGWSQLRY